MENWQEIYNEIGFDEYILMLENGIKELDKSDIKIIKLGKGFKKFTED